MAQPQQQQHKEKPSALRSLTEKLVSGAIAGIIGSTATFPLDVVKTRLQNQKPGPDGVLPYRGMMDCLRQSLKADGLGGLYRALPAVIVGITPEKAIKLGVNDFMCEYFRGRLNTEQLPIPYLVAAGATAGTAQFVATNPMEIVKIRMQTSVGQTTMQVVKELGFFGLYTGARATLLRDIPFSMLYFSTYGWLRQRWTDKDGNISLMNAFLAGGLAGTFSAAAVTPADVIKTRLQAKPTPGQAPYTGIRDVYSRIVAQEGHSALFRGAGPRVIVIAPLFAIALAVYELQKKLLQRLGI
eukprot:TRINITY_DN1602_c0_g1_i1.p1 TRINITY_DN1602_c0_g1~~TRINITY_DN1602_c0_g1_i1.p1  ORF type:complete len:307 (+),score=73.62 TRINITY_DN1602_c0_g1_i1:28-921(+)